MQNKGLITSTVLSSTLRLEGRAIDRQGPSLALRMTAQRVELPQGGVGRYVRLECSLGMPGLKRTLKKEMGSGKRLAA
jgi:hypothetical protein